MRNGLVVAVFLVAAWTAGILLDQARRHARAIECEQAGGAFVLGTSDFICAKALQGGRP